MPDQTRPYRMRRRAESQQETRRRITESAVALHGSIGPSQTSLSAVAAHAGVRRSTLYRHFADEAALFDACSVHWAAANPLPDLGTWAAVVDVDERLSRALGELYSFYAKNEAMLANLFRDESAVAIVRDRFAALRGYFQAARETLVAGRKLRGPALARTKAAVGHAISFSTWRSLVREQSLDDAQAVALLCDLVATAQSSSGRLGRQRPPAEARG
jgi:AcrR family transcriptional regulator